MAHCIQAIVAKQSVVAYFCDRHNGLRYLALPQDFAVIPVERKFVEVVTNKMLPQSTETFFNLVPEFVSFLTAESVHGRLAYIETEYFGDAGGEGALVCDNQSIIMKPAWQADAVLEALRYLGVKPLANSNMFQFANECGVLGIGDFRSNEKIYAAIESAR